MINTKAMYDCVDKDGNGEITFEEWMRYWLLVRRSGYTNEEIEFEV